MTAERIKFKKEYADNLANAKRVCAEMRQKQKEYLRQQRAEFAAEEKRKRP